MRVLLTCGGTGGHIYPAVAIAKALQAQDPAVEILFVGAEYGMEKKLIPREGFRLQTITVTGLSRKNPLAAARSLWQAGAGLIKAARIVRDFKPDVAIGTGGYVSGPAVLAASLMGIPTLIHEQNAFPGLTTRILARFASIVAVSHDAAVPRLPQAKRIVVTGLPIRPAFYQIRREEARAKLGLPVDARVILSVGGSGGAENINRTVCGAAPQLLSNEDIILLQVTGDRYHDSMIQRAQSLGWPHAWDGRWQLIRFMQDMPAALAAADLVISRAGASTLEEIAAVGVPAIVVPSPNVTDNHQEHNARALAQQGAAVVILDNLLTETSLLSSVNRLLENPAELKTMAKASKQASHPRATEDLVALVRSLKTSLQ
ncbi:MAG: undecaprenyldiphospho-muramoylpentapeptide beta-N-acetylglucosaminyltransferase [Firmicutes bacterium]|nr:undecaprenyldiphospho-muramoylpentapeptide beta-N-acetylglucosaminyltransferase [Bacillota bacterium]